MRFAAVAMSALLTLAACAPAAAPSPSPTPARTPAAATPTPTPAAATPRTETVVFTANLAASNEVPPIANDEKGATGTATLTFTLTRDAANKITKAVVKIEWTVKGLTPTSKITASHIHNGPAGVNAGVVVDSTLKAEDVKVTADTATFTKENVEAKVEVVEQILSNPPGFYWNVHSTLNPGGVTRGQLQKKT